MKISAQRSVLSFSNPYVQDLDDTYYACWTQILTSTPSFTVCAVPTLPAGHTSGLTPWLTPSAAATGPGVDKYKPGGGGAKAPPRAALWEL